MCWSCEGEREEGDGGSGVGGREGGRMEAYEWGDGWLSEGGHQGA